MNIDSVEEFAFDALLVIKKQRGNFNKIRSEKFVLSYTIKEISFKSRRLI